MAQLTHYATFDPADHRPAPRRYAWSVFAILFALMVVDYVDRQVIVSMFSHLKAQWDLSDQQLGGLVSIVSVTVALGAVPLSLLADRWSRVKSIFVMTDPRDFSCAETLRNGLPVTIRHLRADDRERIAKAVRQLDRESVYTRLFSYRKELTESGLDRIMRVDPEREVALVVTAGAGDDEMVIASGRYFVSPDGEERTAEVAFVVEEDYQGLGIAGRLLRHFARIAREQGITAFEADVLARNKSMLAVFARSGLPMRTRHEGGTVHVTLSLRGEQA
jgi:RimJ/RimL family protein N-acetyltransferase